MTYLSKPETPLNTKQACEFLGLSYYNLMQKVHRGQIPYHQPGGKFTKKYFFKSELNAYVRGSIKPGAASENG